MGLVSGDVGHGQFEQMAFGCCDLDGQDRVGLVGGATRRLSCALVGLCATTEGTSSPAHLALAAARACGDTVPGFIRGETAGTGKSSSKANSRDALSPATLPSGVASESAPETGLRGLTGMSMTGVGKAVRLCPTLAGA